jgi:hypothetical protein
MSERGYSGAPASARTVVQIFDQRRQALGLGRMRAQLPALVVATPAT